MADATPHEEGIPLKNVKIVGIAMTTLDKGLGYIIQGELPEGILPETELSLSIEEPVEIPAVVDRQRIIEALTHHGHAFGCASMYDQHPGPCDCWRHHFPEDNYNPSRSNIT